MNFSMNKPTFGSNPFGGANTAAAVSLNKPFGMSSAAPTGFGMNQNNPSGNMFGGSSAVGQGTNAFQSANTFAPAAANPFGMNTSSSFGASTASNPFGTLASPSTQSSMGAFGGSNPSGGMFGSSNPTGGMFGGSNPTAGAFGGSNPTGGIFGGSNPSGGAFGGSLTAPNSGFNQSPSGLFGGNKSAFPSSSTITYNLSGMVGGGGGGGAWGTTGVGSGSPFGAAAAAKPNTAPFGSNPFGASPAGSSLSGFTGGMGMGMGGSNTGLLGGGASSFGGGGGAFSAQQQQPVNTGMGAFNTAAASPFGQPASTNPFGMGQATASSSSLLGSTGGFMGSGGAVFGASSLQMGGTGNPPFQPLEVKDTVANGRGGSQQTTLKLQSICGMNQYNSKSLEELRLEDYSRNNRGPSKTATGMLGGGGGMLGGGTMGGNVFGAKPATGGFGSNLFGSSNTAAANSSPAQQQQLSVGIFGAPQQQQQMGGAFGNQITPSPFGQSSAFSGAPAGTGFNFGTTTAPTQNIFGGAALTPSASSNQQQISPGLFSTASTQQQPPALFSASQQPNGFNFGSSSNNTGTAPSSFNSFGSLGSPQPGSMTFGASINPAASTGTGNMFNFGNTAAAAGSSNLLFSSANNANKTAPALSNAFNSSFSSFAKPAAASQPLNFSSGFTSFNAAPSFNQQQTNGMSFMPQQQQQQFTSQFQQQQPQPSIQQQQQQQQPLDVAGRIDLLKKKEEEIRSSLKEQSKSSAAAAVSSELKQQVPNLFSGFIGGKASHQRPLSHYSPAASSRSTARLLPRGMRTMIDAALPTDDGTASQMGSAASPWKAIASSVRTNETIPSPAAAAATASVGRNTKRLLILSTISSPVPDPTQDLPRAPPLSTTTTAAASSAAVKSMGVGMMSVGQQTPSSLNNSAMMMRMSQEPSIIAADHSSSSSSSTIRSGDDATGLTPAAAIGTPFHYVVDPAVRRKGGAQTQLETAVDTAVTTPITFHLMSSGRGTDDSSGVRRLLSHEKKNTTTKGDDTDDGIQQQQQQMMMMKADQQSVAPTLRRADYCCTPDISVLHQLPACDLARIHQFTVTRPNYGKIVWAGETDVRGLDLDAIITIGRSEVGLYENNSCSPPPSVGSELNKRATITLYNVFPKQGSTDRKKQEFDRKLRDYCLSSGAEFISYDRTTGSWEFEVQHFSRYGLMDSDDEDEEEDALAPVEERKEPSSAHRLTRPAAATTTTAAPSYSHGSSFLSQEQPRQEAPAAAAAAVTAVSENIRQLRQLLVSRDEAVTGATGGPEAFHSRFAGDLPPSHRRRLTDGAPLEQLRSIIALKKPMPCSVPPLEMLRSMQTMRGALTTIAPNHRVESEAFQPIHQSPSMMMMMRVKRAAAEATGVTAAVDGRGIDDDFTRASLGSSMDLRSVSSLQRGMRHYSLSMSRSFRVGWSADGRIAHPCPAGRGSFVFSHGGLEGGGREKKNKSQGSISIVVSVQRVDPLRWMQAHYDLNCTSTALHEEPLSAILKGSHQCNTAPPSMTAGNESIRRIAPAVFSLPLWSSPTADPLQFHEYVPFLMMLQGVIGSFTSRQLKPSHPDWATTKAMELINATIGQERSTFSSDESVRAVELMPLREDRRLQLRPEAWERRREAQSRWMEEVTAPTVTYAEDSDSGVYGQSDATYTRLFDLLSCHRIYDAIRLAEGAGMFRLAALLTQLDGDSSVPTLLRSQLEVWAASGADTTIPGELLKVYRLIAGSVVMDGPEQQQQQPESSLQGLGWERAVGMLFWYCSSTDSSSSSSFSSADDVSTLLSTALDSYRIVLQDSFADAPVSPHVDDRDPLGACVSYPIAQHGLYSLLTLLFPTSHPSSEITDMMTAAATAAEEEELELEQADLLLRALAPSGYTRDELDHRASYLLLVCLECAGISDIDSTHGRIVRLHYIYQLLSEGMWLWAIFVALQISDVSIRYALTRDIIFRFGPMDTAIAEDDIVNYLRQLNVPVSLFHEAKAYFSGCQWDYKQEVSYLVHAGLLHIATEKAVNYIVPAEILASGDASRKLLDLLELIIPVPVSEEDDDGDDVIESVYCDYWSNLGHIFLTFLRLKHSIEGGHDDDDDDSGDGDAPVQWAASDIYEEALELLNRLSAFAATSSASSSRSQLSFSSSERQRMDVVLFDVSSYVHRVLQGLETAAAGVKAAAAATSSGGYGLIAPQYLKQLPLFSESVVSSVRASNSRYLRGASVELLSCFSDYFNALPMT